MKASEITPIVLERAAEKLRQERETFNQQKIHEERWFLLRLVMGYSAVVLLVAVMVISSYILLRNNLFPASVVTAGGAALFVDVLGLLIGVWKIALNPAFLTKLAPVTQVEVPEIQKTKIEGDRTAGPDPSSRATSLGS